jgi:hypothetical protein
MLTLRVIVTTLGHKCHTSDPMLLALFCFPSKHVKSPKGCHFYGLSTHFTAPHQIPDDI